LASLCFVAFDTLLLAMYVFTSSESRRFAFLANCLSFCDVVCKVLSDSPRFFSFRSDDIISPRCTTLSVRARSLVKVSELGVEGGILAPEPLVRIRTLACGAGDPGFKSQRARQYLNLRRLCSEYNYILSGATMPMRFSEFLSAMLMASTNANLTLLRPWGFAFITGSAL
jgi:hypothetical protein